MNKEEFDEIDKDYKRVIEIRVNQLQKAIERAVKEMINNPVKESRTDLIKHLQSKVPSHYKVEAVEGTDDEVSISYQLNLSAN